MMTIKEMIDQVANDGDTPEELLEVISKKGFIALQNKRNLYKYGSKLGPEFVGKKGKSEFNEKAKKIIEGYIKKYEGILKMMNTHDIKLGGFLNKAKLTDSNDQVLYNKLLDAGKEFKFVSDRLEKAIDLMKKIK